MSRIKFDSHKNGYKKLLKFKSGIHLDVGAGENKQPNFVGMDVRPLKGIDIVHDMESVPYPLEDNCCISILASHVVEHINPANFGFVNVMNEWWRIMKPKGRLVIATPYPGSRGYWQDPTHINGVSEVTLAYFDPSHNSGLWNIYKPKPWKIVANAWQSNGNLEAVLEAVK